MSAILALVPIAVFALAAARGVRFLAPAACAGAFAALLLAGFPAGVLPRAFWIAAPMAAVLFAGVLLREVANPRVAAQAPRDAAHAHRRLFVACFLLGPFFECAVGFGIGAMFALPFIFAARREGANAAALAMLTQCLVPWGAMAMGPMGSADIAGVNAIAVGEASAAAVAWTLPPFLVCFWWLTRDLAVSWMQRLADVAWLAMLWLVLDLISPYATPDAAGIAACAIVAGLRLVWDERPTPAQAAATLAKQWPYVALTLALAGSRLVPEIGAVTKAVALPTASNLPAFAPFHHASFWLLLLAVLASRGRQVPVAAAWSQSKRAIFAGAAFILFGEALAQGGFAAALVDAYTRVAGDFAIAAVPILGALGGMATGSALAASAVNLPLTLPLMGDDPLPAIGAHVAVAAAFTAFSPARVTLAAGLSGLAGDAGAVYRELRPLMAMLCVAAAALFAWGV
jgi:lactate permease